MCAGPARGGGLCDGCRADARATMHPSQRRCGRCALRLGWAMPECPDCARRPPAYGQVVAGCDYEAPADLLITRLKGERRFAMAGPLAALILDALAQPGAPARPPDAVLVPVPAARASLRRRGFNPAAEIARALARATGLPVRQAWLRRVVEGPRQASLDRVARLDGVAGAYACPVGLPPCTVLLVDDVMTTGATLDAAARALRAAGASEVLGLVAMRAPAEDGGALAQYRLP
ncbi:ComF family protein [Achromobacter aloeverae]|uniref:ComF family protein n=1 Tax=Achromobacter aloeverae TaxID=1750518 RepID=A0A4Q1HJZ2_9BURK|nr:phosphoribosyltransferase family protein [Achromobacter aloeverae]RXN86903.1 ComF family protein [Achromobacter aloeverae]